MPLYTILIILLIVALIGGLPTWGWSANWGWAPSGGFGLVIVVILVILLINGGL